MKSKTQHKYASNYVSVYVIVLVLFSSVNVVLIDKIIYIIYQYIIW